jgi:hypothetical protein
MNNSHRYYYHLDYTSRLRMKVPYSNSLEASIWRAYCRKKKKGKGVAMARGIASQFPFKDLQRMAVGSEGVSDVNYGGYFQTLNCTNLKGGKLSIGRCYENDQKSIATGTCKNLKKYLSLLKLIESSIKESKKIDHLTTFLRAQFLYGAEIQNKYTDSFRGNLHSYIITFDAGYELSFILFPIFRTSMVEALVPTIISHYPTVP